MPQSPRSVMVKKRWRGRKETAKVMAMQLSTKVILLFLFLSRSCLLWPRIELNRFHLSIVLFKAQNCYHKIVWLSGHLQGEIYFEFAEIFFCKQNFFRGTLVIPFCTLSTRIKRVKKESKHCLQGWQLLVNIRLFSCLPSVYCKATVPLKEGQDLKIVCHYWYNHEWSSSSS